MDNGHVTHVSRRMKSVSHGVNNRFSAGPAAQQPNSTYRTRAPFAIWRDTTFLNRADRSAHPSTVLSVSVSLSLSLSLFSLELRTSADISITCLRLVRPAEVSHIIMRPSARSALRCYLRAPTCRYRRPDWRPVTGQYEHTATYRLVITVYIYIL